VVRGTYKRSIAQALSTALESLGVTDVETRNPWYFPSIGEYTNLLEQQGFEVTYAILFTRPTPLADKQAGIANWIQMFATSFIAGLTPDQQTQVIHQVEQSLREKMYSDGSWTADYKRLRFFAMRV